MKIAIYQSRVSYYVAVSVSDIQRDRHAGGATIVDFTLDAPGNYILVDHALARLDRGAWGVLTVTGEENDEIFRGEGGHTHDDH